MILMGPVFGWEMLERAMNMYNLPKSFILLLNINNLDLRLSEMVFH